MVDSNPFQILGIEVATLGLWREVVHVGQGTITANKLTSHQRIMYLPRWWFQIFFTFTPNFAEDSHFDEHIIQMGWWKSTNQLQAASLTCLLWCQDFDAPSSAIESAFRKRSLDCHPDCGCFFFGVLGGGGTSLGSSIGGRHRQPWAPKSPGQETKWSQREGSIWGQRFKLSFLFFAVLKRSKDLDPLWIFCLKIFAIQIQWSNCFGRPSLQPRRCLMFVLAVHHGATLEEQ